MASRNLLLAAMAALCLVATAGSASADTDKPGCQLPAWAPQRMAGFVIADCATKSWTTTSISLPQGDKTLAGRKMSVDFTLADPSKNGPSNAALRNFFLAQGKKAGGKVMTDPNSGYAAYLVQTSPKGETWFLYDHGSGNEDETGTFTLTTIQVMPAPQLVQVQAVKAAIDTQSAQCKDQPWLVKQDPAYKIDSCDNKVRDSITVDLKGGTQKTLEGPRTSTTYVVIDDSKSETDAALQGDYIGAFKAAGMTVVSDPTNMGEVVATQKLPIGEFWYIYEAGGGNSDDRGSFTLTTVQLASFNQEVTLQPMKASLDTTAKCGDAPWVVKQFPQYKVSGCDNRIWDVVPIDLPSGHKDLTGARSVVTYTITDEKKIDTDVTIQRNYLQALKAMGATVVSDPANLSEIVATQKSPQGEFWYRYQTGSGNSESRGTYDLTTVQITPFPQIVQAQLMKSGLSQQTKPCRNPDWLVKQFPYFAISDCSYRDFDQITVTMPDGSKKTLVGRMLDTHFNLSDEARVPTSLYVYRNYANALQAIGAKLVSDSKNADEGVWTQKTPQGEYWYIYGKTSGNDEAVGSYVLTSVQIGGPPPKTCTLEVYGVNFDFNKATLRPESEPVLRQVLALFNADPSYFAELGGHTDNIGTAAYNLKLSGARALAVKAWLVSHGLGEQRVTPKGYGDTRPLVPNTTDANRFKNRRVELKRANCK